MRSRQLRYSMHSHGILWNGYAGEFPLMPVPLSGWCRTA